MKYEMRELKDFTVEPQALKPRYPHGLQIVLQAEEMKKLGLQAIPKVGEKAKAYIQLEAIEVSQEEDGGDEKSYTIKYQITDMEIDTKEKDEAQAEQLQAYNVMYGAE